MTKKISKNVLEKIKKDQIKPAPKWEFLLKKSFLWTLLIIALVIGGLMASVVIFHLNTHDWMLYKHQERPFLSFIFESLPYFWLVLMGVVVLIAYYEFKNTNKGYKYPLWIILPVTFVAFFIVGVILFGTGVAKKFENQVIEKIPQYREMVHEKDLKRWNQPDKGVLAGEMVEFVKKGEIVIESFDGTQWTIVFEKIEKPPLPPLEEGVILKTLGQKIDDSTFEAMVIVPWERNMMKKPLRKKLFLNFDVR